MEPYEEPFIEDNTLKPTDRDENYCSTPSPTSSIEMYHNFQENCTDLCKERHTIEPESDFRKEYSNVVPDECPKVILDSNTPPEKRKDIVKSLKRATTGEGKKRLKSLEKTGYFVKKKGRKGKKGEKRGTTNSILISAKKETLLDITTEGDGNLHMEIQNDSIDNRFGKDQYIGRYDHHKTLRLQKDCKKA